MPLEDDALIANLLRTAKTIAVVGASPDPDRDSNMIMEVMLHAGYDVIPVNPRYTEVLGRPCVPSLRAIDRHIDIVDIFRRPDGVPEVVEEAIAVNAGAVWMQFGTGNPDAARRAEEAGLAVVYERCIKIEHMRLL